LNTSGTIDETPYYLTDANMNVTALVDTSGAVVERYVYEPYGAVTFHQADWQKTQLGQETPGTLSAYANDILYSGYRRDAETGLYDARNRVYHPLLGRWLQRDPLGYVDGMSLYEYCGGGPMGATDPSRTAAGPLDRRHLLHSGESDQRQYARLAECAPGSGRSMDTESITSSCSSPRSRARG
jgi:RHS repeat-associated protein